MATRPLAPAPNRQCTDGEEAAAGNRRGAGSAGRTEPLRENAGRFGGRPMTVPRRIAALCLLAAAGTAGAQSRPRTPDAAPGGPSPSALDREGVQFLFDYDFADADRVYRRFSEEYPDHPFGPYNRAAVVWTRLAQRSGGMRGSAHQGDRYWTQTRKPEASPEDIASFRRLAEEALSRAERALESDPGDLEVRYYRGATEALQSGWKIVVERSYLGGARLIRRAVGRHRDLLEADPGFADAYAVPGAWDYGVATLPRAFRVLAFLFGVRGNLDRGLDWVGKTAREGRRAKWGALWTLAVLLQREKRFDEALAAIRTLRRRFPRNADYPLEEAAVLVSLKDYAAARDAAEAFLRRRDAGFGNYHLAAAGLPELRLGESLLFAEEWEAAEEALTAGLAAEPVSELRALLHFRRGNARDGGGLRRAALGDYLRVEQSDADPVLAEWAAALRREPWPTGAPAGAAPE